eukprot:gene22098-34242_t
MDPADADAPSASAVLRATLQSIQQQQQWAQSAAGAAAPAMDRHPSSRTLGARGALPQSFVAA